MESPKVHVERAKKLTRLLDAQWKILGFSFGIDAFFDIIPGVTSIIPTALSLYLLYIALIAQVPSPILGKMLLNILIDYVIGIVPIIGFFGDIFFKSNVRNLSLIESYLEDTKSL